MTSTPEEKRDAWLALVKELEGRLAATMVNARSIPPYVRAMGLTVDMDMEATLRGYDATAWAAKRLLDALKGLPAPEVPVDHEKGQDSLLEGLSPAVDNPGEGTALKTMLARLDEAGPPPYPRSPGAW